MNTDETRKLLNQIFSVYPTFIKKNTDKAQTISQWNDAFKSVPFEVAEGAFKKYAAVGKFPPTIADILGKIPKTTNTNFYGYGSQEELDRMVKATHKAYSRIHKSWTDTYGDRTIDDMIAEWKSEGNLI